MAITVADIPDNTDDVRQQILLAAQELFNKFGFKKTTLEDIANVLRKGKSSLYYYFKNKEEIFKAVVEMEEEFLLSKLTDIVNSADEPKHKLETYVLVRMEITGKLGNYSSVIREEITAGNSFYSGLLNRKEEREKMLLKSVLEEGVAQEIFQMKNCDLGASAILMALKGLEVPLFNYLNNMEEFKVQISNVLNILFFGLLKR